MASNFFPPPTERQGRVIWFSVTALAVAVFLCLLGVVLWGIGWGLQKLSPVLLPLAIAGILAYLLDPLVDLVEIKAHIPRGRAIFLVFFIGLGIVLLAFAVIIPQLFVEVRELFTRMPEYWETFTARLNEWQQNSPWGEKVRQAWTEEVRTTVQGWASKAAPVISGWFVAQAGRVAEWIGLLVGLALVPVYLFYLLLEKRGIRRSWTEYLPIQRSKVKDELVFIIQSINDYLILFFRGQVLVALADGVLLTIGFFAIGLNYALLLGMTAGLLSIVPFLGVVISLVPAIILAVVQFGDWLHPLLVLGLFTLVQMAEGLYISPKIMGDKVGLHPLTIIIAVMVGTTMLGGIIGGILAIPLTAALRVLMFRYVWRPRVGAAVIAPSV